MSSEREVHHRKEYEQAVLLEQNAGADPIALFDAWMKQAELAGVLEPHAMSLATAGSLTISCRIVLLRAYDARGFVFYTNNNSRKALDLERDPRAAVTFFWPDLERQIRIEGRAEPVTDDESEKYFDSRPRESKIAAWSSDQSRLVEDRQALDARYTRWQDRFAGEEVPRPLHWGGYRIRPVRIEFWQGRPTRLHDRIAFEQRSDGSWMRMRLQP